MRTASTCRTCRADSATVPAFFLPRASDAEQGERLYEALAEFAGAEPGPPGERVRSISFTRDGVRWTATVGEPLAGERVAGVRRAGRRIDVGDDLTTTTLVLAVYAGTPCTVVTDAQPITSAPSVWANPFTAEPDHVELFDRR